MNWASEASPTLGCSIKILHDIFRYVGLSTNNYVCQNAWADLRSPNTRTLKASFGHLKLTCDTRIIHFYYTLEQL